MEYPEERYYKLNRFLLSVTGLWPYQNKWRARFIRTVITVIMLISIFSQISNIFKADINIDFLMESLPMLVPTVGTLCQMYTRVINMDKFKELFEHMWNDWALEKTDDEIKIMHQHAESTRLLTIYYSLLFYIFVTALFVWLLMPEIVGGVSSRNDTLQRMDIFHVDFPIDKEQNFYSILFWMCIVIYVSPLVLVTSSSLYLVLTQHVCGMCTLLGCRAERLFYISEDTTQRDLIRETKINYKNIVIFVKLHYNIIKFVNTIEICHTIPLLMDLVGIVITLSLWLMQILTIFENVGRACTCIGLIIATLCYLTIPNYMGQRVTDMSSSICEKVYNCAWYDANVREQKLLLLIMNRRHHPLVLTACKFYAMSLQSFEMILQMGISYCMFMRQMRE